jgi:protein TonB
MRPSAATSSAALHGVAVLGGGYLYRTDFPGCVITVDTYSEEGRKARVQGVVVLAAEIDANGRTGKIRVVQPLGLGLDERAIAAAALWRFHPATSDGQPVPYPVTIEINFRLL